METRVSIPNVLIQRLQGLGPHFCLVKARDKDPSVSGKGWQKAENLMFGDHPRLREHLKRGGNYGVVGGFGLIILDADIPEVKQAVEEKLPPTFTVESPGSKGWHCYFLCGLEKPIRLRDKDGENVGDVQGPGKMVVGPGSVHPNGGVYRIIRDLPLAQVTKEQIIEALKPYVVPDREIERVEATARLEKRETDIDLDILQVVPLAGLRKQGDEYYGPHPVHGSETGRNFRVNPSKNCWHCFRCGSGGGPLLWLAVETGIIECAEAGPGALRGEVFKRVLEKAVERGYIKPSQVSIQKYGGTGTRVGDYWLKKKGNKVFLVAEDDKPVLSCNLASVDGPRFKNKLREITGLEEKEIDRITAGFQLALQSVRKTTETKGPESEPAKSTVDAEVVKRAEALLRDPLLLCRIAEGLRKTGLVGETKNGLLTFLTEVSSKLPDPINVRWSHRASIGKSTIVTKAATLYPPEDLIIRGGLTKKALYYLPEAEDLDEKTRKLVLRGKVLIILEESESQDFLNEVKPLLSHDVPVLKYGFVEEKVTRTVLLEGWPAYIGVTTTPIKGEEHQTRTLLASPDRGEEKYGAVIDDDAERHAFPWLHKSPDLEVFHEAVRQLKLLRVWAPWLPIVSKEFPRKKASAMRDWKKLRTYIEAVAFLHQYQRPHIIIDGEEHVEAIPLDLEIAIKIVEGAMAETVMGIERDVKEFYDFINENALAKEETKEDVLKDTFTYKDLMRWYEECFGEPVSKTTLRDRYVEKLEDLGLLEIDESKKPYKISLCSESSASLANFEKALSNVRSEETKAEIIRKTSAKLGGVQEDFFDEFEKFYSYALSNFADLKRLLEKSKSEEYPEKTFFFESAKDAEDFSRENKKNLGEGFFPDLDNVDEKDEEDIVKRSLCDKCGRELGKLREDGAWLCDACYAVSRLKAEWTEDLTEEEIIARLVQLGLTPRKAKDLFEDLSGTELFWYDKDGKTVWKWA